MRFLRWLDSLNGRPDNLEATGGLGFLAGMFLGAVLTAAVLGHQVRAVLELCIHG